MSALASRASGRLRGLNPAFPALFGAACISSSAIAVSLADQPAGTTAFYRCALALALLYPLSMIEQRRRGARPRRLRLRAVAAGAFLGVDLVLWTHAIYDLGAGVATVLGNLQVLFVTALAWAVFGERPKARFLVALPVVLGGVVLVSGLAGHHQGGYHPLAGLLYGLGTSVTYAAFILILHSSTSGREHVAGPLADASLGAALAALVLGLGLSELRFSVPLGSLGWLVFLAVVSQCIGWLLITSALPRLAASLAALLLLLQPASSLFLAAVFLSERPSWLQLVGAALVCAGVVVAARAGAGDPIVAPEPTPG